MKYKSDRSSTQHETHTILIPFFFSLPPSVYI